MILLYKFLSASILLSLLTSAAAGPIDSRPQGENAVSDLEEFQKLLDQVDPPSLHAALHDFSPKKFKHGMFQQDRTAVEVIHRDDAPLATSIVSMAKRQNPEISNSTATSAATTTTQGPGPVVTPVPQGPSTPSSESNPSPSTATTNGGSSSPGSPSSVTSSPGQPSTSESPGSASAAPSSAPVSVTAGALLTTTNAAGVTVLSTLSVGSVVTTVNAAGVTIVSTVGGGSRTMSSSGSPASTSGASTSRAPLSSQTSLVVQTTTLPNGQKSTVTAVTMVTAGGEAAATPSGTAGVSSSRTASSSPGLQTGMAARTGEMTMEMLCVVGGAVGMAMLM